MILLVRHGETSDNARRVIQLPDATLSARGMWQAARLADRLRALGAVHVLCSDLVRARMTAAPLAGTVAIEETELLRERDFGALRGTPYAALTVDPFAPAFVPPGGERVDAFHARVAEAFARVIARRREVAGPLAVITHGLVCRAIVERHAHAVAERFDNAGITVLAADPPFAASVINDVAHLDGGTAELG